MSGVGPPRPASTRALPAVDTQIDYIVYYSINVANVSHSIHYDTSRSGMDGTIPRTFPDSSVLSVSLRICCI